MVPTGTFLTVRQVPPFLRAGSGQAVWAPGGRAHGVGICSQVLGPPPHLAKLKKEAIGPPLVRGPGWIKGRTTRLECWAGSEVVKGGKRSAQSQGQD